MRATWQRTFALLPVPTEDAGTIWLKKVWCWGPIIHDGWNTWTEYIYYLEHPGKDLWQSGSVKR